MHECNWRCEGDIHTTLLYADIDTLNSRLDFTFTCYMLAQGNTFIDAKKAIEASEWEYCVKTIGDAMSVSVSGTGVVTKNPRLVPTPYAYLVRFRFGTDVHGTVRVAESPKLPAWRRMLKYFTTDRANKLGAD